MRLLEAEEAEEAEEAMVDVEPFAIRGTAGPFPVMVMVEEEEEVEVEDPSG